MLGRTSRMGITAIAAPLRITVRPRPEVSCRFQSITAPAPQMPRSIFALQRCSGSAREPERQHLQARDKVVAIAAVLVVEAIGVVVAVVAVAVEEREEGRW